MSEIDVSPATLIRKVQEKRLLLLEGEAEGINKDQLALMRDIAKTSVDELRVVVDSQSAKAEQELAAIMTKLVATNGNPFLIQGVDREPITLEGEQLPDIDVVEGELSTEPSNMDYKTLMSDT